MQKKKKSERESEVFLKKKVKTMNLYCGGGDFSRIVRCINGIRLTESTIYAHFQFHHIQRKFSHSHSLPHSLNMFALYPTTTIKY